MIKIIVYSKTVLREVYRVLKSKYLKLGMVAVFVVAVALWALNMAIEDFNFPFLASLSVMFLGGAAIYAAYALLNKQPLALPIGMILSVFGFIALGIAFSWKWWIVLVACVLSIALLSGLRIALNLPKWDGDGRKE